MDYFTYKQGRLFCEGVPVEQIAAQFGTPVYIYSAATLRYHYNRIVEAFAEMNAMVCFSVKSLSNIHVLQLLADEGAGFDVVSGGELYRLERIGADMSRVVFAGVAKTDTEIRQAISAGIAYFNVESEQEFENLSRLVSQSDHAGDVHAALRVNPDVDPRTHRYITTGKRESKFGVDLERAQRFFETYGNDSNVVLDAIHMHLGSSIFSPEPYVQAITRALDLIERLRKNGFEINFIDIGGGFAADYGQDVAPTAADYAAEILPLLRGSRLGLILEPGRQITANAGIIATRVLYLKDSGDKKFVIVDAAMTDLVRPAFYGGYHFIWPTVSDPAPQRRADYHPPEAVKVDVVGGVCESADFLGIDRMIPPVKRGDLLAVFSTGAYGFAQTSQFNSRPRSPEVLVDGDSYRLIRRRETYDDLIAPELEI